MQENIQTDIPDYYIYTAGTCIQNPGGAGGVGIVIVDTSTGVISEYSKGYRSTSDARMEIMAVIEALKIIPEGYSVLLYSESQYIVNGINSSIPSNKNTDLWKRCNKLSFCKEIIPYLIKEEERDEWNERCDELAFSAAQNPEYIDTEYEKRYGCFSEVKETGFPPSTMEIQIKIPKKLHDHEPEKCSPHEYAAKYNVKPACAKAIVTFYAGKKRNFRSYMSLKTNGIDAHSKLTLEEIANRSPDPELYLKTIRKYIENEKDVVAAARWNTRGLSLYDSIRKILVEQEVRWNANFGSLY